MAYFYNLEAIRAYVLYTIPLYFSWLVVNWGIMEKKWILINLSRNLFIAGTFITAGILSSLHLKKVKETKYCFADGTFEKDLIFDKFHADRGVYLLVAKKDAIVF